MTSVISKNEVILIDYDDECPICYESLKEKDIAILNCKHTFHYKCIGEWMSSILKYKFEVNENFCPTCKNGDEIENIICREKYIPEKNNNKINIINKTKQKIIIKRKGKCIIS
jgi:hypothetical protein